MECSPDLFCARDQWRPIGREENWKKKRQSSAKLLSIITTSATIFISATGIISQNETGNMRRT